VIWAGAILRSAAVLVPGDRRAEWLREWRAEVCYVDCGRVRFCLGAYRDALWLRLYGESQPWLDSPLTCLLMLAVMAGSCAAIDLRMSVWGTEPGSLGPFQVFVTIVGYACVIMPATTRFSLGEYPHNDHLRRRWVFLASKLLLVLAAFYFAGSALTHLRRGGTGVLVLLWGFILTFRWILADQRRRCPVCLRLLSHPVHVGQASRIFLGWDGTEFLCRKGHGLLHVPETPTSWYHTQRWLSTVSDR